MIELNPVVKEDIKSIKSYKNETLFVYTKKRH